MKHFFKMIIAAGVLVLVDGLSLQPFYEFVLDNEWISDYPLLLKYPSLIKGALVLSIIITFFAMIVLLHLFCVRKQRKQNSENNYGN